MSIATNAMPAADPSRLCALLGRGLGPTIEAVGADSPRRGGRRPLWRAMGKWAFTSPPVRSVSSWNKVSPMTGIKRIFSARGAWKLIEDGPSSRDFDRHRIRGGSPAHPGPARAGNDADRGDAHDCWQPGCSASSATSRGGRPGSGHRRLRLPTSPVQRLDEDDAGRGPPGDA